MFRLRAKIRRFKSTLSSSVRSLSGLGNVPYSLWKGGSWGISNREMKAGINEPVGTDGVVEKSGTDSVLNLRHSISELFRDSLALESVDGIGLGGGRHDNECHHGGV